MVQTLPFLLFFSFFSSPSSYYPFLPFLEDALLELYLRYHEVLQSVVSRYWMGFFYFYVTFESEVFFRDDSTFVKKLHTFFQSDVHF